MDYKIRNIAIYQDTIYIINYGKSFAIKNSELNPRVKCVKIIPYPCNEHHNSMGVWSRDRFYIQDNEGKFYSWTLESASIDIIQNST